MEKWHWQKQRERKNVVWISKWVASFHSGRGSPGLPNGPGFHWKTQDFQCSLPLFYELAHRPLYLIWTEKGVFESKESLRLLAYSGHFLVILVSFWSYLAKPILRYISKSPGVSSSQWLPMSVVFKESPLLLIRESTSAGASAQK